MDTDDFPQQALLDLYAVTGELVIQWGQFEGSLNNIVALLYHDFNGKKHQGILPQAFEQRLKLHAACFNKEAVLAPYALEAREIRSLARKLSFVRDFLAHGFLSLYDADTGIYTFVRLDRDNAKTMHEQSTFKATAVELMARTADIQRLFDLSHILINRLFAITPRLDKGNKAAGSIWVKVTIRDRLVQYLCNLHEEAGIWIDRLAR